MLKYDYKKPVGPQIIDLLNASALKPGLVVTATDVSVSPPKDRTDGQGGRNTEVEFTTLDTTTVLTEKGEKRVKYYDRVELVTVLIISKAVLELNESADNYPTQEDVLNKFIALSNVDFSDSTLSISEVRSNQRVVATITVNPDNYCLVGSVDFVIGLTGPKISEILPDDHLPGFDDPTVTPTP